MAAVPVYLSILFAIAFASRLVQGDGTDQSLQPELTIVTAPHHVIVEKRSPLLLNCSVKASPDFGPLEYEWRKDGVPLPDTLDKRIEIFENGSLHFRRIVHRKRRVNRSSDEGLYECIVGNGDKGRVIARRVRVEVAGIARNFTQEPVAVEAYVGGAARFECSIQATPPAVIVWMKEDSQLNTDDVRLVQLPTGVLQIHSVRETDAGMYRCVAAQNFNNLADELDNIKWKWSRQAALTVSSFSGRRGGRLLVTAKNITVMEGEDVVLECLADGNPKPKIEWQRADKSPLPTRAEKVGGDNLKIYKVTAQNAGLYHCTVSMGTKTQHVPFILEVQTPPEIVLAPESCRWPVSRTVPFDCEVAGVPKPNVSWFFNGLPIEKVNTKHEVSEKTGKLIMYTVELSSTGYYQCIAENTIGQVIAIARLEVFAVSGRPSQPVNLTVVPLDSTTLRVSWIETDPSKNVITYVIHAQPEGSLQDEQELHKGVAGREQSFNLTNLQPFTLYSVRVRAFNKLGAGPLSEEIKMRTMEGVPTATPTFQVSCPKAGALLVEWDEMPLRERGGIIVEYRLQYQPVSRKDPVTTITIKDGSSRLYLIEGLMPLTKYKIRLLAATSKGYPDRAGGWSDHTTCQTNATVKPPALKVDSLNTSAVLVHWDMLNIKYIELRRLDTADDEPANRLQVDPPAASYILSGLANDTDYEVTVIASTEDMQVSHTFRIREGLLVPIPTDIRTKRLSPTAIQLEWRPSVELTGTAEYEVCYSQLLEPQQAKCIKSDKPIVTVDDLQPFTKYRFRVRINLEDREGTFTTVTAETSEDKPGPPVNLTYEVLRRGSIRLQWSPPDQPNGVITEYIIFYNVQPDEPDMLWKNLTTRAGEQMAAEVDDLDLREYYFKMSACNKAGLGNPSDVVVVYPDCPQGYSCSSPDLGTVQPRVSSLSDKQIGIIVGLCIGITCIIICTLLCLCRHRCFKMAWSSNHQHMESAPVYHGNGHVLTGHASNGSPATLPGNHVQVPETVPMLGRLPENELSDSKGGGDMIVTPNGVRINGFVKTNGQLPNGHLPHAHLDLSNMSEEHHSLIAAMYAATNGSHHDSCETALTSDPGLGDKSDSLEGIDHSDTEGGAEDRSGGVESVSGGREEVTEVSHPHHHARTPLAEVCVRDGAEGSGERDRSPVEGGAGSCVFDAQDPAAVSPVGHNGVGARGGPDSQAQQQQQEQQELPRPHPQQQQQQQHRSHEAPAQTPGQAPHLRKPAPSSSLAPHSSPRQLATSQPRSPGHRYLASDLPPPPPPPPPPSPPPTQGVGEAGQGDTGGPGGSDRERGVSFAPPPSLPQWTAPMQQAAPLAALAAAARPTAAQGHPSSGWDSNPRC